MMAQAAGNWKGADRTVEPLPLESMPKRIITAAALLYSVLHSALLTVFLGIAAMILAAYLGAGGLAIIGVGVLGLMIGAAVSRRLWFANATPTAEPTHAEWRLPGIQDKFERLRARQRVLAFLLISALLMLIALRFAMEQDWPTLFGIPRERLLAGALIVAAIVIPLGLLNWRCPNCRRNLGRTLSMRQCPRCGIVLRD